MGCAKPRDRTLISRAGWNPMYWQCFGNALYLPTVTERGLHILSSRAGYDDYWTLVNLVIREAPGADQLIIVEQFSGGMRGPRPDYWFVMLVQKSDRVFCYANESTPLLPVRTHGGRRIRYRRFPAWGEVTDTAAARSLFDFMAKRRIWETHPAVYAAGDRPTIGMGPVLVHAYRARDGVSVSFSMEAGWDYLSEPVLFGIKDLWSLPRTKPATNGEEMMLELSEEDKKRRRAFGKFYERSYPARVVLNGVMRVLYQEYQKITTD